MSSDTITPGLGLPYLLDDGEGEVIRWFGDTITVKAAGPAFDVAVVNAVAGNEPPLHLHEHDDEAVFVLEGEITIYIESDTFAAGAGAFAFVPRGLRHTHAVDSGRARLLTIVRPSGSLDMYAAAEDHYGPRAMPAALRPDDIQRLAPALARGGFTIVGPHPRAAP